MTPPPTQLPKCSLPLRISHQTTSHVPGERGPPPLSTPSIDGGSLIARRFMFLRGRFACSKCVVFLYCGMLTRVACIAVLEKRALLQRPNATLPRCHDEILGRGGIRLKWRATRGWNLMTHRRDVTSRGEADELTETQIEKGPHGHAMRGCGDATQDGTIRHGGGGIWMWRCDDGALQISID